MTDLEVKILPKKDPEYSWRELIADILLIDKDQTYGSRKYANIIALVICRAILLGIGFYLNYFISCIQGTTLRVAYIFTCYSY